MYIVGPSEEQILREITEKIEKILNSAGLFYRIFSRVKTSQSLNEKIEKKDYRISGKKIQDVFGIRVTVYFYDDEIIAEKLVRKFFNEIPESHSIDNIDAERFGPQRRNLIFRVEEKLWRTSQFPNNELIDSTFEIQFRTILSEGWHEVEHDLRYKCLNDWQGEELLNRQLNGQFATLESCNWAMSKIFDELAYKKYKQKNWASFFKNTLRIRFQNDNFSQTINNYLNENIAFAKKFLRIDRHVLIIPLTELTTKLPLTLDNVLFIINRAVFNNSEIIEKESELLNTILNRSFSSQNIAESI